MTEEIYSIWRNLDCLLHISAWISCEICHELTSASHKQLDWVFPVYKKKIIFNGSPTSQLSLLLTTSPSTTCIKYQIISSTFFITYNLCIYQKLNTSVNTDVKCNNSPLLTSCSLLRNSANSAGVIPRSGYSFAYLQNISYNW